MIFIIQVIVEEKNRIKREYMRRYSIKPIDPMQKIVVTRRVSSQSTSIHQAHCGTHSRGGIPGSTLRDRQEQYAKHKEHTKRAYSESISSTPEPSATFPESTASVKDDDDEPQRHRAKLMEETNDKDQPDAVSLQPNQKSDLSSTPLEVSRKLSHYRNSKTCTNLGTAHSIPDAASLCKNPTAFITSSSAPVVDCDDAGTGSATASKMTLGQRLMERVGYKGGGLGRNEQGMSQPIEPVMLSGRIGLGFSIPNTLSITDGMSDAPWFDTMDSQNTDDQWLLQRSELPSLSKEEVSRWKIELGRPLTTILTSKVCNHDLLKDLQRVRRSSDGTVAEYIRSTKHAASTASVGIIANATADSFHHSKPEIDNAMAYLELFHLVLVVDLFSKETVSFYPNIPELFVIVV